MRGEPRVLGRRTVLGGLLGGLALGAAGCTSGEQARPAGQTAASHELEVFSWWAGAGGEAKALRVLIDRYAKVRPDVTFVNAAVAGGAGVQARAVLEQRLQAGRPPGSFQGHAGPELLDHVRADRLERLDDLMTRTGMTGAMPEALAERLRTDGHLHGMPVTLHRANVLWYSPRVFELAGVDGPPETLESFVEALEKIASAARLPLALGESWTAKHLLETVLAAELGAKGYERLWGPDGDWRAPGVRRAIRTFRSLLRRTDPDAGTLTWQEAATLVAEGQAGCLVMGDWVQGLFAEQGRRPGEDYAWAPAPGTGGLYQWLADVFTLPKGVPDAEAARAWLRVCAEPATQRRLAAVKGCLPPRTDAMEAMDLDEESYLAGARRDWAKDTPVGSLTHGGVASNAWSGEIDRALTVFLSVRDTTRFTDDLAAAAHRHADS